MKMVSAAAYLSTFFTCGVANAQSAMGLRAETFGGFDATSLHTETPNNPISVVGPLAGIGQGSTNLNGTGFTYGFGIGYDVAVGSRFSLGLDGEYSETSTNMYQDPVRNTTVVILNPIGAIVRARRDLSLGRDLYIGGRITVPVNRMFNAYIKAGYTNLRVNDTQTVSVLRSPSSPLSPFPVIAGSVVTATPAVTNVGGVRLGVGGQMTVCGKLYTMLEYRFSSHSNDVSRNQVIAGIGLHF